MTGVSVVLGSRRGGSEELRAGADDGDGGGA